jgi:glycosyltransferase involved in cell wall biosynthesis
MVTPSRQAGARAQNVHKLRAHLFSANVVSKDAIGTDVELMASALVKAGYATDILSLGSDKIYRDVVKPLHSVDCRTWRADTDLTIYHHSTGCDPGKEFLSRNPGRIVIRHHNVTPPPYFYEYSQDHVRGCQQGVDDTSWLARFPGAMYWGDSGFNCDDLISRGAPKENCRVLPPFHRVEELALEAVDRDFMAAYKDGSANILFVGGFKPNKGHAQAICVFATYHHGLNSRSRLIFAGSMSHHFDGYVKGLRELASKLGVADRVVFCSGVSAAQLRTLYLVSDVFLCVSEHEGFCVPLVESMYFRVPIVAWGATAVSETLGGCGLVWDDLDEAKLAESIHCCVQRPEVARELRRLGFERYTSAYAPDVLTSRLMDLMQEIEYGQLGSGDSELAARRGGEL